MGLLIIMFGITRSVSSEVQTCTKELLSSFTRSANVRAICNEIADLQNSLPTGEGQGEAKAIKDRISALKKKLPAITPMAIFRDGKRAVKNAIPSGLNMLDIDHIDDPDKLWAEIMTRETVSSIFAAYKTPSTHGLRLIFLQPQGKTIEEGQRWMAEKLGITLYDGVTKDLARLSFLVPEEYFYKLDDAIFEDWSMYSPPTPTGGVLEDSFASSEEVSSKEDKEEKVSLETPPEGDGGLFRGIPYPAIIDRLLLNMGYDGDPTEGERNTALYALTRDMRYICDFNAEKLFNVLPHWGLPDSECDATIKSALNTVRKTDIPSALKRVITSLEMEYRQNESDGEPLEDWQILPKRLPRLLQLLVKGYPEEYRPAVVMSAIVTLGALVTRVRSEYIDGGIHSPSFLCCIVGHQASGKSFVRKIYELLTEPIKRADENARRILTQYKKDKEAAKNSKKQPVEPDVMIRLLPATASGTTILKRADKANSKHIIMFTEELDQLTKGESANWSKKSDILRQAFDNSVWGQDYQSDQSYSAMVKLYYNLICCATPHAMSRFFKDVEDGLVSRFIFCKLPDTLGAKAPNFGRFSKRELAEIRDIVQDLYNKNEETHPNPPVREGALDSTTKSTSSLPLGGAGGGLEEPFDEDKDAIWVSSKRLTVAIEDWLEGHRMEFLQNQENKALEIFRRRAAVIGYRAGLVGYMLCGGLINASAIALALWVAEYTLQNQLAIFGDAMNKVMNEDEEDMMEVKVHRNACNIKIFDLLPDVFTKDDVVKLRSQAGLSTVIKQIVSRWLTNGLIVKVDKNKWQKKTLTQLSKPNVG